MKLILLFSLLSLTLAQSDNATLDVVNDPEQLIFLVVIIGVIMLAILLLVLYDKCCVFWNRVELFRRDTNTDVVDLRELK